MFKNSKQYGIELEGETFSFSERSLEQIYDLDDIKGDMWLVSDMKESISRTMTVEAPAKYAEVTVRKRLQETGEFDEPVSIITHWKKKKGKNTTDIFFTALPTRIFYQYFDWIREHEDSIVLFPLFSVLYSVLKKLRSKEPVAVIFQHNRFADLIIGTKKRVYYANRCVAFDESEDQIFALWDTVGKDIKAAEAENRIKVTRVFRLSWLKSKIEPEWPEEMKSEFYSIEDESMGATISVDLKLNYLASTATGELIAKGRLIKLGKTLGYTEAEVINQEGKLMAHGTSTLMILAKMGLPEDFHFPPKFLDSLFT